MVLSQAWAAALRHHLCARAPATISARVQPSPPPRAPPLRDSVHAVAPFWGVRVRRADLLRAYAAAFAFAAGRDVATPLLGAGGGTPVADARAAAERRRRGVGTAPAKARFGVVDDVAFDASVTRLWPWREEHERFLHRKGKGTSACAFRGAPRGSGEG